MGVMNRFMNFLGLQEEEEIVEREKVVEPEEQAYEPAANYETRKNAKANNVVSIHSQKNVKVVLSEPRTFDDAQQIADHLRAHRSVVVNLQQVRKDQAKRIFDFLNGTLYAINGNIAKVGGDIFLCTPDTVEVEGSIADLLRDDQDFNQMR
ncbi:cell division protein SepF [Saccharibacillus sp. CPCC 101409]|uniref:cell division protein SepF n=1 Tax=Saccharibacillus sp. CPCC 101409 TaxID=3058041 RepID=UPI00267353C3|nr:cell division protein SepF [Saccharibacillus sp. CPCC 101409]MDO3409218.1 cell division protein SepF [Saccharibacillus sp. CPCC 101409]